MKPLRSLIFTFLLALAAGGLTPATVRAQDDQGQTDANGTPSFDYFYDALQPYGQWVQVDGYGYCWQPNAGQDPNWQPYTDGYWAYTDAGWTWVSYEDFGWITYHYGRWTQIQDAGWVWVPDYEWAPAWVSWRQTRGEGGAPDSAYIGWAPLPPEALFQSDIGISVSVDTDYDIGPRFYNFCRIRDFGSPVLGPVIIDRSRNIVIINNTVNITNITTNNNVVFVGGPSYRGLARRVNPAHPIQTLQLVRQTNAGDFRGGKGALAHTQGNQLFVAAPMIIKPKQPFTPAKVGRTFDKPKIDHGWAGTNPQQKQQIQAALKAQSKGAAPHQPARKITPEQLTVIPKGNTPVTPQVPNGQKGVLVPGMGRPTPIPGQPLQTPPPGKKNHQKGPLATPAPAVNPAVPNPANVVAPVNPATPVQPVQTPLPGKKGRQKGPLATPPVNPAVQPPVNPGVPNNPVAPVQPVQTPPPKRERNNFTPAVTNTPPPKPPQVPNNGALEQQRLLQQQQLKAAQAAKQQQLIQQQQAAAAAAAAHRQQVQQQVQTPKLPPQPAQPRPPQPLPPQRPPGQLPPGRGVKPTPTP